MIFSPLVSQFPIQDTPSGISLQTEFSTAATDEALILVDSIIAVKDKTLPHFPYFDRFLSEDKRYEVANTRADLYDLQWKRIEILKSLNKSELLIEALEDYSNIIGYNQEKSKLLLRQLL